jgi:hypothetical protein
MTTYEKLMLEHAMMQTSLIATNIALQADYIKFKTGSKEVGPTALNIVDKVAALNAKTQVKIDYFNN